MKLLITEEKEGEGLIFKTLCRNFVMSNSVFVCKPLNLKQCLYHLCIVIFALFLGLNWIRNLPDIGRLFGFFVKNLELWGHFDIKFEMI